MGPPPSTRLQMTVAQARAGLWGRWEVAGVQGYLAVQWTGFDWTGAGC